MSYLWRGSEGSRFHIKPVTWALALPHDRIKWKLSKDFDALLQVRLILDKIAWWIKQCDYQTKKCQMRLKMLSWRANVPSSTRGSFSSKPSGRVGSNRISPVTNSKIKHPRDQMSACGKNGSIPSMDSGHRYSLVWMSKTSWSSSNKEGAGNGLDASFSSNDILPFFTILVSAERGRCLSLSWSK